MGSKGDNNRQRIVDAADELFYTRGYNQTSFRDISELTGIPRGNFYYYFKTKDDILEAVVDSRLHAVRSLIQHCESVSHDPISRLKAFIISLVDKDKTIAHGCPTGSMSAELAKDEDGLQQTFGAVFEELRAWMAQQFAEFGCQQPDQLSLDLLARLQGAAVVSCAFKDMAFLERSIEQTTSWVDQKVPARTH